MAISLLKQNTGGRSAKSAGRGAFLKTSADVNEAISRFRILFKRDQHVPDRSPFSADVCRCLLLNYSKKSAERICSRPLSVFLDVLCLAF